MARLRKEEIIKKANDYITYMIDFYNNDPNAKYNQKAISDFQELQAWMSIYKYGALEYKDMAFKYIKAIFG